MSTLRARNQPARVVELDPSIKDTPTQQLGRDGKPLPTFTPPSFTAKELLGAIPPHCFERSALKSFAHLALDFIMLGGLLWAALSYIDPSISNAEGFPGVSKFVEGVVEGSGAEGLKGWGGVVGEVARWSAWALYGYLAGLVGTGVWVIAHECGHQSFSTSKTLNNSVGFVLHSALLVPFHSWRISHAKHHSGTGSMTRDQVWVPKTLSQKVPDSHKKVTPNGETVFEKLDDLLEDAPLWAFFSIVLQQLFGWPMYIIFNTTGRPDYPKGTNHFQPSSPIFEPRHRWQIILSDIGLAITLTALSFWGMNRGWSEVVKVYLVPYLWVHHWLVLITYLQHTDPLLPHYRNSEWNFQRGALCTIDRNIHGFFFHGIAETHVAHHLSSKIPHYNAWEATEALKKKLGPYYMKEEENFWVSLWRIARECKYVDDTGDVLFYKNAKGEAALQLQYEPPVSDSGVDVQ